MDSIWERKKSVAYQWDLFNEEGREDIHQWSKDRQHQSRGLINTYNGFLVYTFNLKTMMSFLQNFNFMVIIQMILAGLSIYIFQRSNVYFDMNVMLYISPIVFPLAFSINTDFQRREKVLDDLASFKTNCMLWFFCVREWKEAAELGDKWTTERYAKLKSILFHLREYLLTERGDRRKVILKAMYEDLSDCGEVIEEVRAKKLPSSIGIGANLVTCLQAMTLSFERLRNVREYRSPRSIRAFNKVLILLLPIIIAPYFVNQSRDRDGNIVRAWTPYYISILVSFVFSALQGVQDKLDDPFDGMSEDDIHLEQIDEWTFNSLQATVNRSFKVGRFHVDVDITETRHNLRTASISSPQPVDSKINSTEFVTFGGVKPIASIDLGLHPYADILENIPGDTRIEKGGILRFVVESSSSTELNCSDLERSGLEPIRFSSKNSDDENTRPGRKTHLERLFQKLDDNGTSPTTEPKHRTVLFSENPVNTSTQSNYLEHSFDDPTTPLLPRNPSSHKSRPILSRTKRISYVTKSPPLSPRSTNIKSVSETEAMKIYPTKNAPKGYESIVDIAEDLDERV